MNNNKTAKMALSIIYDIMNERQKDAEKYIHLEKQLLIHKELVKQADRRIVELTNERNNLLALNAINMEPK